VLETPHVAVGAAIATKIPNPLISIPLALASHIVLDRIPHWNPHFYTETQKYGHPKKESIVFSIADVALSVGLGLYVASRALPDQGHFWTILLASFAAVAPDVVKGPYFFLKNRSKLLKDWVHFERSIQVETNFAFGMLSQAAVVIASLLWIL
jgi:hypothetical protein